MNNTRTLIVLVSLFGFFSVLFYGFSNIDKETEPSKNGDGVTSHYTILPVKIPKEVFFANEKVPLSNFDTYESLDKEMLINTYWQSQTLIFLKKAHRYFPVIEKILIEQGVPVDFKYLAVAESGLSNVVSPANAVGFWQFLSGTARDYNLIVSEEVDERYHLEKSTEAAAKFLKESYEKFGTWALAAASYNMGRRNVSKYMAYQKTDNYYDLTLGDETGRYVFRLIALKLIMESPETYGFYVTEADNYPQIPYEIELVDSAVQNWADFAHQHGINYKMLKELNPWLRENKLTNKHHKTFEIKIAAAAYRTILPNDTYYPEHEKINIK